MNRQAAGVARLVDRLGGRVTRDLSIINALVTTMPARAVPVLAAQPGVRWITPDAPMVSTVYAGNGTPIDTAHLQNAYISAIGADRLWNEAPYLQGQGIGVAVVDSGINGGIDDLQGATGAGRVVAQAKFNSTDPSMADHFGHGTHVAGIIGGNGTDSHGAYIGVAPGVNLINVKVSDQDGAASISDVVAGLQWVLLNAATYNIRVVNLSLNSSVANSYNVDPLDAACEILWNHKIVVVASAGNSGAGGAIYAPANDPFVITVGAADDNGTARTADDTVASYSTSGSTTDGFAKPDLVAPGTNIISTLASMGTDLAREHPDHVVSSAYFRMSGTSTAAPVVAGTVALLLQSNPTLTPDQVKYRLMATAHPLGAGAGAGEVDAYAAVHSSTTASANTGLTPSHLLWSAGQPMPWNTWDSVSWSTVSWSTVSWSTVSWSTVSWSTVSWSTDYWGS